MEEMKKEAWVAEFGERSVENPNVVDLIKVDPASGQVVLVMIERREWDNGPQQFSQIEEKINRYIRDFRFACPRWTPYTSESRSAHENLLYRTIVQVLRPSLSPR